MRKSVVAALMCCAVLAGSARAAPAPLAAVTAAKTHVTKQFAIGGLYSVRGRRSERDRSWVVVTGYYRRPKARPNWWAVYLRPRGSGWRAVWSGRGFAASEPKVRAPCDIWPPLSEPSC